MVRALLLHLAAAASTDDQSEQESNSGGHQERLARIVPHVQADLPREVARRFMVREQFRKEQALPAREPCDRLAPLWLSTPSVNSFISSIAQVNSFASPNRSPLNLKSPNSQTGK